MQRLVLTIVTACLAFALIAGCGGGSGSSTPAAPNGGGPTQIAVNNEAAGFPYAFQSPVTVKSGTVVEWVNNTAASHGITWEAVSPNTSPAAPATVAVFSGGTTSGTATMPTVTTQTTYNYQCTIHGAAMPGQVIVTP